MKILLTGAAGYVGSRLVPALLEDGHDVVAYDTFWFGDHLPSMEDYDVGYYRLMKIKADIRDLKTFSDEVASCDAVIHLACLSNDPSSEIDADLTKSINLDAFEPLVVAAKEAGVRRFIYCSSSSVYGISDAPDVREDHPLVPLTLYNKYKAECEPLLLKHASPDFECVVIRPSTVCGYSPRQRLDLAVNILTNAAWCTGNIVVLGGAQRRPNLHIRDMVDCYRALLAAPSDKVAGQTFNVGAGNMTIDALALLVQDEVERIKGVAPTIEHRASLDARSYQVNSDKIRDVLGFVPQHTVREAVHELCDAFAAGKLPNSMADSAYVNVKRMREVHPELYAGAGPSSFDPDKGILSEQDMLRRTGA